MNASVRDSLLAFLIVQSKSCICAKISSFESESSIRVTEMRLFRSLLSSGCLTHISFDSSFNYLFLSLPPPKELSLEDDPFEDESFSLKELPPDKLPFESLSPSLEPLFPPMPLPC